MKSHLKTSAKSILESLETRQLLSAAVSSTEILANITGGNGVISNYLQKHPQAGLNQYLSGKNKSLFASGQSSTVQLSLKNGMSVNKAIELLKKIPQVNWASPNYVYGKAASEAAPNDPLYTNQSSQLNIIKAPQAWDTTTGTGVIIAVLDDGVDIVHEDLAPNIWKNTGEIAGNNLDDDNNGYIDDVNGWDFANSDNNPSPDLNTTYNFIDSHGTLVAGIAAAAINNNIGVAGVAGGAKIMPVRFTGSQVTVTSASIASSIAYAANNGAKVINISFSIDPYQNDPAFFAATDLAYTKGCIWLNSAGNNNVDNPPRTDITKAFFVSNTDNTDAKYSNSNYGTGMDLSAPGVEDYGTVPGNLYDSGIGTSFSTAMSSGVTALIFSAHPTWTRDQVAAQLVGTTDNIDAQNPTFLRKLGTGRLNALKAVTTTLGAPKLRGLVGVASNQTLTSAPTTFDLSMFNVLNSATVINSAFVLQYAGADNVFSVSDTTIPLTMGAAYAYGTNDIILTPGTLMSDGLYRFIAKSTLADPFGKALDGNGDGTAGDDYVVQFSLATVNNVNAPTNLQAKIASYSQTEAELTWNDNSNNELSFVIERSSTSTFTTIDKTFNPIGNSTRYNDWGLEQGKTYYYRIKAVGAAVSSNYSNTATLAVPLPAAGVPAAPSALNGTTSAYSQTEVVLGWTDNSNNETGFVIERSLSSTFATTEKSFNALVGSTQYYDWGLTAGQTYYYRIKAVNGADSSTWSNTLKYVTPGGATPTIPAAPTTLAAGAVSGSNTSIALTWVDASNNETSFALDRSTTNTFTAATTTTLTLAANATTYTDAGLTTGTAYFYRIHAVNSAGASANSNTATFTTPAASTLPAAPTTLAVKTNAALNTTADVTWVDASNNETGFELQRSTTTTFTAATTTTKALAAGTVASSDTGLALNTTYYYRVRAINAAGQSAYTATVTYKTPALTAPTAPSNLVAVGGGKKAITLTWTDNSNSETNFELVRATNAFFVGYTTITLAASSTTYTNTGLTAGTTYYYSIRAVNSAGNSSWTSVASFKAP